jgi:hypothetical protein
MSEGRSEADVLADLQDVLADCGYARFEIPTQGPGSTYVVMVVPHPDSVWPDESDEEFEDDSLNGATAVRVYAIADTEIGPEQRAVLERADGVDMSAWDEGPPEDPASPQAAALLIEDWVTAGPWAGRIAFCYRNDPMLYLGRTGPDRPTALVTVTLPASGFDSASSGY